MASVLTLLGWRQPGLAAVSEGLPILQELRGQGLSVGAKACWSGWVSPQPKSDPEKVGLPGAYLWERSPSKGARKIQKGGWWFQVSFTFYIARLVVNEFGMEWYFPKWCLILLYRNIMMDVRRDNRVLSLVSKAGLRNLLTTMLDQLQRCQKSLNEFLEVCFCFIRITYSLAPQSFKRFSYVKYLLYFFVIGEKIAVPSLLLHWRRWLTRDPGTVH